MNTHLFVQIPSPLVIINHFLPDPPSTPDHLFWKLCWASSVCFCSLKVAWLKLSSNYRILCATVLLCYNALISSAVHYCNVNCNNLNYNFVHCNAVCYNAVLYLTVLYNAVQYNAVQYSALISSAAHYCAVLVYIPAGHHVLSWPYAAAGWD